MAIKPFNSVGGLSVGPNLDVVINSSGSAVLADLTVNGVVQLSAGELHLGDVSTVHIDGGVGGQYLATDGSGNLSWVTLDTDTLANGASNVSIDSTGGDVTVSVGGSANVAVFTTSGITVSGSVDAASFSGDGASLTNITGANVTGDVSGANHANIADVAFSVDGANVVGQVSSAASADFAFSVDSANIVGQVADAAHADVADAAFSVDGANVVGQVGSAAVADSALSVDAGAISGTVASAQIAYSLDTDASSIKVTGGIAGQTLLTDGAGNLSFGSTASIVRNISSTDVTVYSDSSYTPQPDPYGQSGWHFKNTAAGKKINWYPWINTKNPADPTRPAGLDTATKGQFTSAWALVKVYNTTSRPYLAVYTAPTGTGDAASWYKSRWIFSNIPAYPSAGTYLLHIGDDPGVYEQYPRVRINSTPSSSTGTRLDSETLLMFAWNTNSASAVNSEEFTIEATGHTLAGVNFINTLTHVGATLTDLANASRISSGTSDIKFDSVNGPIIMAAGGVANVLTVSSSGASVTGTLSVTGQADLGDVADVSITGGTSGQYLQTDGSGALSWSTVELANIHAGTSNVAIAASNGNVAIAANGQSNIVTVSSNGTFATTTINDDVVITGNLTVDGTTVSVNVTDLNIEDPIISQGRGANGALLTAVDGKDRGLFSYYYDGAEKGAFIGMMTTGAHAGEYVVSTDAVVVDNVVTPNSYGNIVVGNVIGDLARGDSKVAIDGVDGDIGLVVDGAAIATVHADGVDLSGSLSLRSVSSIDAGTITTTSTSLVALASVPDAVGLAVEFLVKGYDLTSGKFEVATLLLISDGNGVVNATVYGSTSILGSVGVLDADRNAGAGTVELLVAPSSANSTVWVTQFRVI